MTRTSRPTLASPDLVPVEPQRGFGGRQTKDEMARFLTKLEKSKEYYLAGAQEAILHTALCEMACVCTAACPYESACSLPDEERPRALSDTSESPYNGRCPVEGDLFMRMFHGYMVELSIDGTRPTELQSAAELAGIHVWRRRIDIVIREDTNGRMVVEQCVGIVNGKPNFRAEEHPLWKQRQYLDKRESEIKKEFLATRSDALKEQAALRDKDRYSLADLLSAKSITEIDGDSREVVQQPRRPRKKAV